MRADLVVGTDGMHSPVREHVAPGEVRKFTGQVAVVGFTKKTSVRENEEIVSTKMILSAEGSFAMMPVDGASDQIMFFSTIETQDRTKEEWRKFNMNKQGLRIF
jgi:2-polyprenyl-6-methoxyphenol hydroxylase-like FAD-dependent oxidoreductase